MEWCSLPRSWPAAADAGAAARLLDRYAALGPDAAAFASEPYAAAALAALGGNSPFLSDLAIREADTVRAVLVEGPDSVVERALADLAPDPKRARLAAALRRAKRIVSLAVAMSDIGGLWTLDQVTAALSTLAETALRLSVEHLLATGHAMGELTLPDPDRPAAGSAFVVLGMGKLGARELNYSSDVDLVLLYGPEAGVYRGDAPNAFFTRLARGLVSLMETRDPDGYVFRTDLRLRPDPAATPPCIALPTAISYYESMGQNWERAAMLKARPVAGDLAMGHHFLDAIRPFIWRRGLDFAAVADIHAMKRRIDAHKGTGLARVANPVERIAGHDVKLGEGGIREIEFLVQTLELVWGGRDPSLREPRTVAALRRLARAGHLAPRAAGELVAAYRFLRRVEHRLQMVSDRQTHTLPQTGAALEAIAIFLGYDTATAFAAVLLRHLGRVRARYAEVFESVRVPSGITLAPLDFNGDAEPPATIAALRDLGFSDPSAIIATVRAWRAGRVRAFRSERARALLDAVLPGALAALAKQPDPMAAFHRFDVFLGRQAAGVSLLSLMERNPPLLERIATVLGAAPSLATHLAHAPSALDGLLTGDGATRPDDLLRTRLADARSLEDTIAIVRATVREEDFRISVATLENRLGADEAGAARADLADAALSALLPRVQDDFAIRNGRVRGGELALVLLGKAGGRETMAGSDLDLMLVYDHPVEVTESDGARRLPTSQWFIRAVQAFVAALTAPDMEGATYAVDMRLRPSGNKGPIAVSLSAFERYHASDAWTWERMALTRARVVAGRPALRARVESAIKTALAGGDPATVCADAADMRARMLRDLPPVGPWDVKLRAGGLVEVEFIAQALQLTHASAHPEVLHQTTILALARLREAGLLAPSETEALIAADRLYRTVQGLLRLVVGPVPPRELPIAAEGPLTRATETVDLPTLRSTLDSTAARVRAAFVRHVGEVGS